MTKNNEEMADKQIIDTIKCRYNTFDGGNTQRTICIIDGCFCDCLRERECYYKQLKRKEQECEELKADYATAKSMYDLCQSDFMELVKIKDQLKETNEGLLSIQYKLADSNKQLRQTLAEIKEIAEKMKNMEEECGKCMGYTTIQCKQILQKINDLEI